MNAREMRNIKKPVYACEMGKGLFAGANWQCIKCGYVAHNYSSRPILSGCKATGGNHIFEEM